MHGLTPEQILALPVDTLGLHVLRDFGDREWNSQNYINRFVNPHPHEQKLPPPALDALAEAMGWLRARALIARHPTEHSADAFIVTRLGKQVLHDGIALVYATERIQGLHARVESVARPQFLLGQFELGVFASLREVEVRVRQLCGFPNDTIGVDLMNKAFGQSGPLVDATAAKGEQDGTRALFAGAYGVLRNPSAHREVDYTDVSEAAEAVQTASLLMRMLDRVEKRLGRPAP